MELKELQDELTDMIQLRMASYRTLLGIPELQSISIGELRFFVKLLRKIDTNESIGTADYIEEIIQKALDGTFQIGD